MSKKRKLNTRSWWRELFVDHPGVDDGDPDALVTSNSGATTASKVYCKACLSADTDQVLMGDLNAVDQGRITVARSEDAIQQYLWSQPRSSQGLGYTRYAVKVCLNHLKSCLNQPPDIHQRAQVELVESPKKQSQRYSPYGTGWSGATLVPGTFPSGSRSTQMLPPSLPPSTRFNSPALSIHSTLPSPSGSVQPSPSTSALPLPLLISLPSPSIDTFPSSYLTLPSMQHDQSPMPIPQSLHVEPATSQVPRPTQTLNGESWSPALQAMFETSIARLTASAGLPLSWVDNPEWIDFVHRFLPWAASPSRKVLSTRLIPHAAEECRQTAKELSKGENATIQADGWTGGNFHHLLAFLIAVCKRIHTINVHDASCERKTADNLKIHLENAIKTVRGEYGAHVVGVVTDASGECRKARRQLSLEYPDIVFLDCYAHQINLVVGDYFKSKAEVLEFTDDATELITWLRSKTLILALLRQVQMVLSGSKAIKAVIRAVITRWTMHYQAFRRLRELHPVIVTVVNDDEERPVRERNVIVGDARSKAKATEMVKLIRNTKFWEALCVVERHLGPLAIAANLLQAAHCRLDTVILTFGYLTIKYQAMDAPEDLVGCTAILKSLEKRWLAADQDVFIAAVIVNPLYRTTPFAPHPRFTNARIKILLASLYSRFFKMPAPDMFYMELHEFLTESGRYRELSAMCAVHISTSRLKNEDPDPLAILQDFLVGSHNVANFLGGL